MKAVNVEAVAAAVSDKLIVRVLADSCIRVSELVEVKTNDFVERSGTY